MPLIDIIAGARPNFMKIAPLLDALKAVPDVRQVLVNTGQHYDAAMAGSFPRELALPTPDRDLRVGSGRPAVQPATVMPGFEEVCLPQRPDLAGKGLANPSAAILGAGMMLR